MADLKYIAGAPGVSERFLARLDKSPGCWLWTGTTDKDGYGKFCAIIDGKKYTIAAHRLSAAMAIPEFSPSLVVRHKCDNPLCCNPEHLVMGTQAQNIADREARGRGNHKAKLPHLMRLADSRRGVPRHLWPKKAA